MNSIGRFAAILTVALALAAHASACGSEARAIDGCRTIENARCERAPACITDFRGDVESCKSFYEVQCGRGVHEAAKEPSRAELNACVDAIRTNCEAVTDPVKFCPFLTANEQPVVTDTGVAETAADIGTAADGGDSD